MATNMIRKAVPGIEIRSNKSLETPRRPFLDGSGVIKKLLIRPHRLVRIKGSFHHLKYYKHVFMTRTNNLDSLVPKTNRLSPPFRTLTAFILVSWNFSSVWQCHTTKWGKNSKFSFFCVAYAYAGSIRKFSRFSVKNDIFIVCFPLNHRTYGMTGRRGLHRWLFNGNRYNWVT